ncbi:MAG: hypothetical protein K6A35_06855 [bacterium]|nr:hypothetical protein [bacterium]
MTIERWVKPIHPKDASKSESLKDSSFSCAMSLLFLAAFFMFYVVGTAGLILTLTIVGVVVVFGVLVMRSSRKGSGADSRTPGRAMLGAMSNILNILLAVAIWLLAAYKLIYTN